MVALQGAVIKMADSHRTTCVVDWRWMEEGVDGGKSGWRKEWMDEGVDGGRSGWRKE